MFIRKDVKNGKSYYVVLESYKEKDKPYSQHRTIVSLGHAKSLDKVYAATLAEFKRISDKLHRIDYARSRMQPGA